MRRKLVGLAVAALLITTAARPANAQARGYIGFGAGLSIPTGAFGDSFDTGWLGQVVAGITSANGMLGGRVDGQYLRNEAKGSLGKAKLIGANFDIVWTPGKRPAKLHPYLLGGVGFYNNDGANQTKFAYNLGGGLQIHLGGSASLFTEARWISIQTSPAKTNFIPIVVGLRFGGV